MTENISGINPPDAEQPIEVRGTNEVISREVMHDRFGMILNHDTIKRADGSEGHQYWVDFPRDAVMIFPKDEEGYLYLNNEHAYAIDEREIAGAGGSMQAGETGEDTAIREVREELGVEVKRVQHLGSFREITSRVKNKTHVYLADVASVGDAHPETGEDIKLERIHFETVFNMVRKGVINNAVVCAAIYAINELAREEVEQQPN